MKKTKRVLALLIAAACTVSLAVPAFAADYTDITNNPLVGTIVDEDGNSAYDNSYDTIKPGDSYYYIIGPSSVPGYSILTDDDIVRVTLKKKTNGKQISDADLVEKRINGTRYVCIQFDVKDNFTSDEYKAEMEAQIRARKNLIYTTLPNTGGKDYFPLFSIDPAARALTTPEALKTAYDQAEKALADAKAALAKSLNELRAAASTAGIAFNESNPVDVSTDIAGFESNLQKLKTELEDLKNTEDLTQKATELRGRIDALEASIIQTQEKLNALKSLPTDSTEKRKQLTEARDALTGNITSLTAILTNSGVDVTSSLNGAKPDGIPVVKTSAPAALVNVYHATNADDSSTWTNFNTMLDALNQSAAAQNTTSLFSSVQQIAAKEDRTNNWQQVGDQLYGVFKTNLKQIQDWNVEVAKIDEQLDALSAATDNSAQIASLEGELSSLRSQKAPLEEELNKLASIPATAEAKRAPAEVQADIDALTVKIANYNAYKTAHTAWGTQKATVSAAQTTRDTAYHAYINGAAKNTTLANGKTYTHTFRFWIQNENREDDDATFVAGEKGVVIKPVKNEKNTVTWENSNDEIARMTFIADSDTDYYCPRLSTRWNHEDYLDYFDGTEAYLFDFVSNPRVPATTRPTLELFNPFVDDDGELTVRESRIRVYEVKDGELEDRTSAFDIHENDDGDYVISTRTFVLGTYIVSDGEADIPAKRPDKEKPNNRPDDDKPSIDINDNKKPIPNTGR